MSQAEKYTKEIARVFGMPGALNKPSVSLVHVLNTLDTDDVEVNSVINVNRMVKEIEFTVEDQLVFKIELPFVGNTKKTIKSTFAKFQK